MRNHLPDLFFCKIPQKNVFQRKNPDIAKYTS